MESQKRRLRVGVLFGGRSGEHEVSLASAMSVLRAMDLEKYRLVPIGITREGRWLSRGELEGGPEGEQLRVEGEPVSLLADSGAPGDVGPLDVVFPILHGTYGEDGSVQGLLEMAGVPYVGSGVAASAVAMDKVLLKLVLSAAGLAVGPYRVVTRDQWEADPVGVRRTLEAAFDYPWFTKPANLGSSVGISKVHGPDELAAAMNDAAEYDRKIVVEQGISQAREIEVAVLGNEAPEASICGEILPSREFYDYAAKYVDGSSELLVPSPLPAAVADAIREQARRTFSAVDAAGLGRVDFLVRGSDLSIFVNEINTMPGFTEISMYPKLWSASGLTYGGLIDRLIALALQRHRDRQRNRVDFDLPT